MGFWERFLAVLGSQNPLGSCFARNVQNFGVHHVHFRDWTPLVNMACRDGCKNNLKQLDAAIFFCTAGQIGENRGRGLLIRKCWKIKISQDPTIRFELPFVQPQIRSCSFGWWSGELPENSLSKVWTPLRSATRWWNIRKFLMHEICVTYITKIHGIHMTKICIACIKLDLRTNSDLCFWDRFLAVLGLQNSLGSCAARNVQNFRVHHVHFRDWAPLVNMACSMARLAPRMNITHSAKYMFY